MLRFSSLISVFFTPLLLAGDFSFGVGDYPLFSRSKQTEYIGAVKPDSRLLSGIHTAEQPTNKPQTLSDTWANNLLFRFISLFTGGTRQQEKCTYRVRPGDSEHLLTIIKQVPAGCTLKISGTYYLDQINEPLELNAVLEPDDTVEPPQESSQETPFLFQTIHPERLPEVENGYVPALLASTTAFSVESPKATLIAPDTSQTWLKIGSSGSLHQIGIIPGTTDPSYGCTPSGILFSSNNPINIGFSAEDKGYICHIEHITTFQNTCSATGAYQCAGGEKSSTNTQQSGGSSSLTGNQVIHYYSDSASGSKPAALGAAGGNGGDDRDDKDGKKRAWRHTVSWYKLIANAIAELQKSERTTFVRDIYEAIEKRICRPLDRGEKGSIRYNLSLREVFTKKEGTRKRHQWSINPTEQQHYHNGKKLKRKTQSSRHRRVTKAHSPQSTTGAMIAQPHPLPPQQGLQWQQFLMQQSGLHYSTPAAPFTHPLPPQQEQQWQGHEQGQGQWHEQGQGQWHEQGQGQWHEQGQGQWHEQGQGQGQGQGQWHEQGQGQWQGHEQGQGQQALMQQPGLHYITPAIPPTQLQLHMQLQLYNSAAPQPQPHPQPASTDRQ